ncbi:MAG: ATP-binding protein [Myxococcota bacterium]
MNGARSLSLSLTKISDWFLGPQSGPNAEELLRRGRLLLLLVALSVLNLAWTAAYQISFGSEFSGKACLVSIPFALLPAFALRLGVPIPFITSVAVVILYSIAFSITLATAGRWPAGLFFLVLVPVEAVLLVGRRAGLVWSGIVLASLLFAAQTTQVPGFVPLLAVSDAESIAASYRIACLVMVAVFSTAYFYSSLYERTNAALRESVAEHQQGERRFRALADNAYDLIAELDESGRLTYASPGHAEGVGRTPEELIGRNVFDTIHPDDLARCRATWATLLEKGAARDEAIRFQLVNRGLRFFDVSLRSYLTAEGALRVVAVTRDVTERLERDRLIRHQQNLVTMGTMAAGTAHQLSNPIGSILSAAQYAKQFSWRSDYGAIADECFDGIEEDARRCALILKSMLAFAREERAERWVEKLELVIYRAITATRTRGERPQVEIVPHLCREPVRVLMSPIEIEQVLINLMRNAMQANASRVVVESRVVGDDRVEITISDDGTGIAPESQAAVFDPFFTTRPESGSGLGLSVAREILLDHGGTLELVRSDRDGTTFRIELPLAP